MSFKGLNRFSGRKNSFHEGDPLPTAYLCILSLRIAYGLVLALSPVYRFTTTTFFRFHLHKEDKTTVSWHAPIRYTYPRKVLYMFDFCLIFDVLILLTI